jgi:hypothetical protein
MIIFCEIRAGTRGKVSMAAALGAAGLGGAASNNNIFISINYSLCGIYVCDTSRNRRKTDG